MTRGAGIFLAVLGSAASAAGEDVTRLQSRTAPDHPIQYFVSLPQGWTAGKTWPVVMVIASADKQFEQNAELFVRARGAMPFIVVAPLVLTNGGPRYREAPTYHYSDETWSQVERVGRCKWDVDGILAVVRDVKKRYGGEDRVFLTGWEAGGHPVWTMAFQHPEALRAAAPSCPNYIGRCMESGAFSSDPSRAELPINVFMARDDPACVEGGILRKQADLASKLAREHGYQKVSMTPVAAKEHGAHPQEILAYFSSLLKR